MLLTSLISKRHYKNLEWFYTHSIIRQFALSLFSIFNSIYVYQTLNANHFQKNELLALTALFFALAYLSQLFFIKFAVITINRFGLRKSMLLGGVFTTLFSLTLYLGKYNLFFLIISAVLAGAYLAFYYIAFHIYFTELTDDASEGEEVALGSILPAVVCILGPICAGLLIKLTGFGGVFLVMGISLVLANFPLQFIPNTKDGVKINAGSIFSFFKSKTEVKKHLALSGYAISSATDTYFWPIFIFPILSGSFIQLGLVGSLIAVFSTISIFLVGYLIDKKGPSLIIKILAVCGSLVWIGRVFVKNPLQVYLSSSVQALAILGTGIALDSLIYSKSRGENDIYPILQREINYALTKCIFLLFMGILFWLGLPLITIFVVSAISALLVKLYTE